MGITSAILETAFDAAREADATQITAIHVSVGELTEIVDFALHFAFDSLTPGTMAEGAELTVTYIPARSRCKTCGTEYAHDRFEVLCPECGSMDVELLAGRELQIDNIETGPSAEEPSDEAAPQED
jgi:hydrogenase nickel incorporation protein HypA/HybF